MGEHGKKRRDGQIEEKMKRTDDNDLVQVLGGQGVQLRFRQRDVLCGERGRKSAGSEYEKRIQFRKRQHS